MTATGPNEGTWATVGADLLCHDVVHGHADHEVTGIGWPGELGEGASQERIFQTLGRLLPERDGWLPGSVAAQGHGIALVKGVQQGLADGGPGSPRDRLGPGVASGRIAGPAASARSSSCTLTQL